MVGHFDDFSETHHSYEVRYFSLHVWFQYTVLPPPPPAPRHHHLKDEKVMSKELCCNYSPEVKACGLIRSIHAEVELNVLINIPQIFVTCFHYVPLLGIIQVSVTSRQWLKKFPQWDGCAAELFQNPTVPCTDVDATSEFIQMRSPKSFQMWKFFSVSKKESRWRRRDPRTHVACTKNHLHLREAECLDDFPRELPTCTHVNHSGFTCWLARLPF